MSVKFNCASCAALAAIAMLFAVSPVAMATEPRAAATVTFAASDAAHGWAVNYPKQRKVFVMADRLWVFYSDGVDGVFRSSVDGATWTDATVFAEGGHFGHRFGGAFDGRYFHFVLCTASLGDKVYYRRGLPQADGAIAWSAPLQVAYDTPSDKNVMYPKLIVDSDGYPWVTFMELVYQEPNTPPYDVVVLKAATNDGAWSTADAFPFRLVDQKPNEGYPDPVGVALTGGKTCWVYNTRIDDEDIYAARVWNGDAWEAEEVVVPSAAVYSFFDAVAEEDTVHLVHGAGTLHYQQRTMDAGWSDPAPVAAGASGHSTSTRSGDGGVIVTWLDMTNHRVCYREKRAEDWGVEVTLWEDADETLAGAGINLNGLVASAGPFKHSVTWTTGAAPPFTVRAAVVLQNDSASSCWSKGSSCPGQAG